MSARGSASRCLGEIGTEFREAQRQKICSALFGGGHGGIAAGVGNVNLALETKPTEPAVFLNVPLSIISQCSTATRQW
ncbi:hypothetical protein D917_02705 [Trichinella nativa]|uniref:Uncharacterized protein n=1 Tax=Trichinella nativa TaxID=6335 RepID=A0A1Y3EC94_9BILA|nr:hypothetical protein D917_02705 [Trichinella nativa]